MREIVLDTETTGLNPAAGHRVVEVGCVELINHVPSGREFQVYVNPERDMPEDAFAIHGLSTAFLADKPVFAKVADAILAFLGDAPLVIHNAEFDLGFLNAEFARIDYRALPASRGIDTVRLARRKNPGAPANLDALCRRYAVDATARDRHGALLDAQLLAEVYLQLIGGRQPGLVLRRYGESRAPALATGTASRAPRAARPHAPSAAELKAHEAFVESLEDPIWRR